MLHIKTENYGTLDRDFVINTYKNNNLDEIVIEAKEITNGRNVSLNCTGSLSMNNNFNLPIGEYSGYAEQLTAVKKCILLFVATNPK